jgi:DNA anti-recombination protein RmuC
MADTMQLPEDDEELAMLYELTIDHHHNYLERLHGAFDRRCEEVGAEAKKKLAGIDESDEEAENAILQEEQELLDKTLAELKYAINKSNANARKKLEEIQNRLEANAVDLDAELANL